MSDIIIIGSGPAGISAALYAARAGLSTTIVSRDSGALAKAEKIENYYGLSSPVSGLELSTIGRQQALKLGVSILEEEVFALSMEDLNEFTVLTNRVSHKASCVILATGASRKAPPIPGLSDFEGRGVSYCAVCDAFFFRKKDVAILGNQAYALHEAEHLLPLAASVTLLTNGTPVPPSLPDGLLVRTEPISTLEGKIKLEQIRFQDGSSLFADGLFVALGTAGSADFARKIGAEIEGGRIKVDPSMASSVPGLFAAGDCTGGMLQIAKAVYEGAQAASSAIRFLRAQKEHS